MVVDIETQELLVLVSIGMTVVTGGVDEIVSVGNWGKGDEVNVTVGAAKIGRASCRERVS